jgi:hypothetical protein
MTKNEFPTGWDEERTQRILTYYETQTAEDAVAEDEAVFEKREKTLIEVPAELVPTVRALLARYYGGHQVST